MRTKQNVGSPSAFPKQKEQNHEFEPLLHQTHEGEKNLNKMKRNKLKLSESKQKSQYKNEVIVINSLKVTPVTSSRQGQLSHFAMSRSAINCLP